MIGFDVQAQKDTSAYVNYTFDIEGDLPQEIKKKIKSISTVASFQDKKTNTVLAIKRRLVRDQKKISLYLKSKGYFDHQLDDALVTKRTKLQVILKVRLGPQYKFGDIEFVSLGGPIDGVEIPIEKGTAFSSEQILKAEEQVLSYLKNHGYVFPEVKDRSLVPDADRKIVAVVIHLDPGPLTCFGDTNLVVGNFVKKSFIENRLKWKKGTLYNQHLVNQSRDELIKTEIFDGALVKPQPPVNGQTPIDVTLTENKRHYLGLGADYSTEEGIGGKAFWGHRNLWGGGENLKISYEHLQLKKSFQTVLNIPDTLMVDQTWHNKIEIARESFDAYDADLKKIETGLSKPFGIYKRNTSLVFSDEKVDGVPFFLVGLPCSLSRDTTTNEVDPSHGQFIEIVVEPNKDTRNRANFFCVVDAKLKTYFRLNPTSRFTLAMFGKMGNIFSKETRNIPDSRLFYIGGAKSIRGYKYQYAGPLTKENKPEDRVPTGGRSYAELETEFRYRISDQWGGVAFVDTGLLTQNRFIFGSRETRVNSDDGKLFTGVGIGARYYFADMSPLRLDIAMPLTRRNRIDNAVQVYASFGHSF